VQNTSRRASRRLAQAPEGLRARKKQKTRQALIEAAMRLYREKGFEGVTIAAIAEEAEVAARTFFSYFETKEDVFLGRGDDRLDRLVHAIQHRDRRQPILKAVHSVLLEDREPTRTRMPARPPGLSALLEHPAIANRLRERWNHWEDLLANAIARDVGARSGDPEPRVVAAALTGAIRVAAAAALEQPRRSRQIADRVFRLLASGLSRYGAGK
jgi:AcrR family transcriptional regulator